MKNLIISSVRLFRTLHLIPSVNLANPLIGSGFATAKSETLNKPRASFKQASDPKPNALSSPIENNKPISEAQIRSEAQKTATKFIEEYMTINDIKGQPGALSQMLFAFVRVLQYTKQNSGRDFYLTHKQQIQKIFYDVRSYSAQSCMKNEQILMVYYFSKLIRDYGYSNPATGFQLRSSIKLSKQIATSDHAQISDPLTLDQVVYGRWLMAVLGISNHEFKWNSHMMITNLMDKSKNVNPSTDPSLKSQEFPIKFNHICAIVSAYYHESIHLTTDYKTMEVIIRLLWTKREEYGTYEQLMKNQNAFLELFSCLSGFSQHFFSGKKFYQTSNFLTCMSAAIEKRLISWLFADLKIQQAYAQSKTLAQFLSSDSYSSYIDPRKQKDYANRPMKNFNEEDLSRYFIFFNDIHQNEAQLQNLVNQTYQKLVFLLNQIFDQYFSQILAHKSTVISEKVLSICTKTWLIKASIKLKKLQKVTSKKQSALDSQQITQQLDMIVADFIQLLKVLNEKSGLQNQQQKISKKSTKPYLTVKEKQAQELKLLQTKNIQKNIIKPIVDFIFGLKMFHNQSQKLIPSSKVATMIEEFAKLLTNQFGTSNEAITKQSKTKFLSIENKYFWMLKFMHHQFMDITENKTYLKEFESLLLEHVVKNNAKQKPENFYTVFVYNFYAYMCLLQEKMMANEDKTKLKDTSQEYEIKGEAFHEKKEYKYFLAYKTYLSNLIFSPNQSLNSIVKNLQVPNKLRIDSLFQRVSQDELNKNIQQPNKQTTSDPFMIRNFFTIVFRQNRFYNHKLLSEEFLLNFFGNEKLYSENFKQHIQNKNQRSGQNYFEVIYMILLAGDANPNVSHIPNAFDLKIVKSKVFQALTEKAKGNLVFNIIRSVAAPRKTSFLKPPPLKYRLRPYSIFETVRNQPLQRKKQVMNNLLHLFYPSNANVFGFIEILLENLNIWKENQKSEIVWDIIMQWLLQRMQKGQFIEASADFFVNFAIRLVRRCQVPLKNENAHVFIKLLYENLPKSFSKATNSSREFWKSIELTGYLLDLDYLVSKNMLNPKQLPFILKKCLQILLKAKKQDQNSLIDITRRSIHKFENSSRGSNSFSLEILAKQRLKEQEPIKKMFNNTGNKLFDEGPKVFSQSSKSNEQEYNDFELQLPTKSNSQRASSLFTKSEKRQESSKKNKTVKKGMFSKKA